MEHETLLKIRPETMDLVPAEHRLAVLAHLLALQARLLVMASAELSGPPSKPEPLCPYRLAEAADLLRKSPPWLRRRAKHGQVPGAHKVGKSWTFDREPFDRYRARPEVA